MLAAEEGRGDEAAAGAGRAAEEGEQPDHEEGEEGEEGKGKCDLLVVFSNSFVLPLFVH